jgi:hypothetical protein
LEKVRCVAWQYGRAAGTDPGEKKPPRPGAAGLARWSEFRKIQKRI